MLTRFAVKGFKNFGNKMVFDLENPGKYDFNNSLIQNNTINKGIIYGKNGSGKSNLGEAIFDIENNLMALNKNSFSNSPFSGIYKNGLTNADPEFEYSFKFGDDILVYSYTKKNPDYVSKEKLVVNSKTVLDYTDSKVDSIFCTIDNTNSLNFENMSKGISPLLFIYRTVKFDEKSVITKLFNFVKGMLWFRCLNKGNEFRGYKGQVEMIEKTIIEKDKIHDFQKFLKENADLDYDLSVVYGNQINPLTGEKDKTIVAKFGDRQYPLYSLLSTGTEALELFYYWHLSFKEISFLFIDEFDAFYHYELSARIVKLLNTSSSFQSFVTTHNTSLMNNDLMRPDCIFIISDNCVKSLNECTYKELREAHNLEKIYRNKGFDHNE